MTSQIASKTNGAKCLAITTFVFSLREQHFLRGQASERLPWGNQNFVRGCCITLNCKELWGGTLPKFICSISYTNMDFKKLYPCNFLFVQGHVVLLLISLVSICLEPGSQRSSRSFRLHHTILKNFNITMEYAKKQDFDY